MLLSLSVAGSVAGRPSAPPPVQIGRLHDERDGDMSTVLTDIQFHWQATIMGPVSLLQDFESGVC